MWLVVERFGSVSEVLRTIVGALTVADEMDDFLSGGRCHLGDFSRANFFATDLERHRG